MRERCLSFWCYALLFIVPFFKFQFFVIDEQDDNSTRQEFHLNFMEDRKMRLNDKQYLYKNYIKDNDSKSFLRHEFFTNSMTNENIDLEQYGSLYMIKKHENDNQMPIKLNDKNNSTLYDFRQTFNEDNNKNIVPYKMCDNNTTCIQLCCRLGDRLIDGKCGAENGKYLFPNVYEFITNNTLLQNENKRLNELFQLIVHDPCQKTGHFVLNSDNYSDDEYIFLANGSLYQPHHAKFIRATSYCLAIVHREKFDVIICIDIKNETVKESKIVNESINEMRNETVDEHGMMVSSIILNILDVLSLLFLLMTFVVYSILPQLQNIHSYMLRRYVGSTFVGGICFLVIDLTQFQDIGNFACFALAFVTYYFLLASCCWLNVMSFDMWKTFRKIRPLKRNVKLRKRKKIIIYSIYAWGSPLVLAIICGITEFIPNEDKPKTILPIKSCWFNDELSLIMYYYVPMSINTISSICLSIYTILKIMHYEKELTRQLRYFNVRRHNNMQWVNSYLKMFIVMFIIMSINWILLIALLVFKDGKLYIIFLDTFIDLILNFYIFIIFVWKKRVKRLLQKRFGRENCVAFPKTQQTIVTVSSGIHIKRNTLQNNMNSYERTNCRANSSFGVTAL